MTQPRLTGVTIAVDQLQPMADFYSEVFGAMLSPQAFGAATLYSGTMAGLSLQLCPKEVAGVEARQNIHQLRFTVPDVAATIAAVVAAGGRQEGEPASVRGTLHAAIRDPEGNSIELVQG